MVVWAFFFFGYLSFELLREGSQERTHVAPPRQEARDEKSWAWASPLGLKPTPEKIAHVGGRMVCTGVFICVKKKKNKDYILGNHNEANQRETTEKKITMAPPYTRRMKDSGTDVLQYYVGGIGREWTRISLSLARTNELTIVPVPSWMSCY